MFEFLWKFIQRFDARQHDSAMLSQIIANQQLTNDFLGELMPKIDELKAQGQQNTAALNKVLAEVTGMSSRLKELQEQGDAKIAEAIETARVKAQGALEATLVELQGIQNEQSGLINALDALNPDAVPVPEPPVEPTEPVVVPPEPTF